MDYEMTGDTPEQQKEENTVKSRYGFLPSSVWYCTRNSPARAIIDDNDKALIQTQGNEGGTTRMSEFDPEVADRIIKYWSNPGDFILDPFSGRATRAICAAMLGRNYQGYEISPKHHAFTVSRLGVLERTPNLFSSYGKADIVLGDGVVMNNTPDNSADLIMTCPPYWNVEKYESVPGQLSDIDDYQAFMEQMARHAGYAYAKLKPGKHAVYIVNDIRRNRRMIPWHADMIRVFESAGFRLHDLAINKVNSAAMLGVWQYEVRRTLVKCHEFILIFYKPIDDPEAKPQTEWAQQQEAEVERLEGLQAIEHEEHQQAQQEEEERLDQIG